MIKTRPDTFLFLCPPLYSFLTLIFFKLSLYILLDSYLTRDKLYYRETVIFHILYAKSHHFILIREINEYNIRVFVVCSYVFGIQRNIT